MSDETADLSNTLTWTCGMVLQSGPEDRQRIALAYQEAQQLVATIPTDNGDARPRIVGLLRAIRRLTERPTISPASVGY